MDRAEFPSAATRPAARSLALLFVVIAVQFIGCVISNEIGATIIQSRLGWLAVEGGNVTLDCQKYGRSTETICNYIAFTKNWSVIPADVRHRRSGPAWISTSLVNCSMTITGLTPEDSGLYGCCWGTDSCPHHNVHNLTVLPLTTTVTTTTVLPTTPSIATTKVITETTTAKTRRTSESNGIAYRTVAPVDGNQVGNNNAQTGNSGGSIHRTIWPLLLVAAVIVALAIIGRKYYRRRKAKEAVQDGLGDHDIGTPAESSTMIRGSASNVSTVSNGVITTTTTTTTVLTAGS